MYFSSNERIKFMEEEQQKLNEQLRGKDDSIVGKLLLAFLIFS